LRTIVSRVYYTAIGLALLICSGWNSHVFAQTTVEGEKFIPKVYADSLYKLELWILPESIKVRVKDVILPDTAWSYDKFQSVWQWKPSFGDRGQAVLDSVLITYERYPFTLRQTYAKRQIVAEDTSYKEPEEMQQQVVRKTFNEESLFGDVDLDRSGSLTRGITVGSNRDLSLESGLRFDMNGQLSDEIEISASLTDESTPIQPDGSTQNLREFDQVFIKLRSQNSEVQLGDVDIKLMDSEFGQIQRRLQGIQGNTETGVGDYRGAFSVARGRFRTEEFNGRDGVQGPYRLLGNNNNQFITVLAGSERVYIDGQLLTRGEENDYVIDYGLGEIRFTKKRIITDQTRIVVDYQFIEEDFTRTLLAADAREDKLLNGKLSVGATVIREADSDNLQASFGLSNSELQALQLAGDSSATISGADSVGFSRNAEFLLYAKVDTVFNGQEFEIFKHIPGDSAGVFRVRFTRVGEGKGTYRRVGQSSNGVLFEWVGPNRGAYEPFRELPSPEKQQMVTLQTNFRPNDKIEFFGEIAGSTFDLNRFSPIDDDDNFDQAYNAGFKFKNINTSLGVLRADFRQRFSGRNFEFFDRTRIVEFDRKWNINGQVEEVKERITEASAGIKPFQNTDIEFSGGVIDRDNLEGNRQQVKINTNQKGYPSLDYRAERIESTDFSVSEDGEWFRQIGSTDHTISTGIGDFTPVLGFETERREQTGLASDSLTSNSFNFWDLKPGINFNSGNLEIGFNFSIRDDNRVLEGEFEDQSISTTQNYSINYNPSQKFNTETQFGFRNRDFSERFEREQNATDRSGVLIQSVSNFGLFNQALNGQFFYEANTEREAILQEAFVEVGPENGQFVWEDTNDDGVQQVDEFFEEQTPNEGIFIKQFIPSDELLPVIDLRTRLRNRFQPSKLIQRDKEELSFWGKMLKKFEMNSTIEIRETNTTDDLKDIYLLKLSQFRNDSTTINGQLFLQQELRLFPENPKIDISFQVDQLRSLNQRTTGVEERSQDTFTLESSYRLKRRFILKNAFSYEQTDAESERLTNRNFDITSFSLEPGFDFIVNRSLQTGLEFEITQKEDRQPMNNTEVDLIKITSNTRAFLFKKIQTSARLEWQNVNLNGESTSFGAFELTDGAGQGSTFNWAIRGSYRISDLVRASLNYDGRTVQDRGVIQTMRIIVSAVF